VVDLLGALNTGHDGGAGTLHANAPADVPARLEALGMLGGLPRAALHAQMLAALQVVLQVRRTAEGRVLESVSVLLPAGHERLATVVPAWVRGRGAGPAAEALARMLAARGVPVPAVLSDPVSPACPPPARSGGRQGFAWSDLIGSAPAPLPAQRHASPPPPSRLAAAWSDRPATTLRSRS
jgi:pilus assembly protein CpaF